MDSSSPTTSKTGSEHLVKNTRQRTLYEVLTDSERLKIKNTDIRNSHITELTVGEIMHLKFILDKSQYMRRKNKVYTEQQVIHELTTRSKELNKLALKNETKNTP